MKRQHKEHYEHLDRHFSSIFWRYCCMCDKDFRREWGWRALTGPWGNGAGVVRFLCGTCAPTRADADKIFLKRLWLGKRPKHPTPPPPPKTVAHASKEV